MGICVGCTEVLSLFVVVSVHFSNLVTCQVIHRHLPAHLSGITLCSNKATHMPLLSLLVYSTLLFYCRQICCHGVGEKHDMSQL